MALRPGQLHGGQRERVREILGATSAFRAEEIDVALELFDESFADSGVHATGDVIKDYEWIGVYSEREHLVGCACFGPTPCTEGTYDLYWIAAHPDSHRTGAGSLLMNEVERLLALRGARILVIETSSRPEYAATRRFYERRGYVQKARIRDFYAIGDDRLTYLKRVHSRAESHRDE